MSPLAWLFGPKGERPRRIRVIMAPDNGQRSLDWNLSVARFRVLVAILALSLLGLVFLLMSSGSLLIEKRKTHILERQLEERTRQLARLASLEGQVLETARTLLQVRAMLGINSGSADSLLASQFPSLDTSYEGGVSVSGALLPESEQILRFTPGVRPVRGVVTRGFVGEQGEGYHPGLDIAAAEGQPILAAADGIVLAAGWSDEYGNFILLDHGLGFSSLYAHNSTLAGKKDDRIRQGEVVAYLGNTGRSTAPHLHFEIRRNGVPVDPENYLLDW